MASNASPTARYMPQWPRVCALIHVRVAGKRAQQQTRRPQSEKTPDSVDGADATLVQCDEQALNLAPAAKAHHIALIAAGIGAS